MTIVEYGPIYLITRVYRTVLLVRKILGIPIYWYGEFEGFRAVTFSTHHTWFSTMKLQNSFYKRKLEKAKAKRRLFIRAHRGSGIVNCPEEYIQELNRIINNDEIISAIQKLEKDISYYEEKLDGGKRLDS